VFFSEPVDKWGGHGLGVVVLLVRLWEGIDRGKRIFF